jgi:GNAT superfamily N-acetyltransferase
VVRQARRDDADAIADAHVQAWRVAYRPFFPAAYLDSDEFDRDRRDRWRSWSWQRDGTALFVPVLDGRVVGFAFVGPERTEADDAVTGSGEVYSFYLHPSAWGSGAAAALMDVATDGLRGDGFTEAGLWVLRDNARACAFYSKSGWWPTGAEADWSPSDAADLVVREARYTVDLRAVHREHR